MTKNIEVQSVKSQKAKNGSPWLAVEDTQGGKYSVWEQILFHLFSPGARLEVSVLTKGKYTNIVDVIKNDMQGHMDKSYEASQENPQKENKEDQILKGLREIYAQNTKILEKLDGLEGVNN